MKRNILTDLFLTFMKVGLFTFGGGYAMIALMERTCVEEKKWITHDDMMNVTVIAESTPGPIAINCATFVGCRQAGIAGAVAATIGIVLPSFAIIYAISMFLEDFLEITVIAHAFKGIKLAVGLLILQAGAGMVKKMQKKPQPIAIMLCAFAAMLAVNFLSIKLSSITLMAAAGLVSFALFAVKGAPGGKEGQKK